MGYRGGFCSLEMSVLLATRLKTMGHSDLKLGEQVIGQLLCKPQILVELFEACLEGKNPQSLAEIVLQDAPLSARILETAGKTCPKKIDASEPVTSAIQQLGLPVLTGIALQAAKQVVGRNFSAEELQFLNGLWYSSHVAGQTARCLAPSVSYPYVEEAQLCGLLLNLGNHALFAHLGTAYAELAGVTFSNAELFQREEQAYSTNHLQVAESLVSRWQLDSFLVDAISFLHIDIGQIEKNSPLLKISRLAQQLGQDPQRLSEEGRTLAERLFSFRRSEIDYLFEWARGLYRSYAPPVDDQEKLFQELTAAQNRLAELTFVLADLEGVRARLANCPRPEDLVREARNLYLESSAAHEAVFLLVDQKNSQLNGITAEGQARLVGELKISLEASASLASKALLEGRQLTSFQPAQPLTVIDHQLRRLCNGKGICCLPYRFEGRMLGAVVLGVDSAEVVLGMQDLRFRMFGQVMSDALVHVTDEIQERFVEGSSLLRRVSNELSNPLTIIGNYAEVLSHMPGDKEKGDLTESIKKEIRRIDDVLNYYVNQQEMPFFPDHSVSLNHLAMEATEALQATDLEPRRIEVRFELMEDLPKVPTNGMLVKQILVNLIKNAAEAIGEDGVISLSTRETYCADEGRLAEIVIQDDGPGIDPQIQDRLFRPVVSTKGVGHAGVGLSVVKNMVDDIKGRISCHSSPATGTAFHLQIPCGKNEGITGEPG